MCDTQSTFTLYFKSLLFSKESIRSSFEPYAMEAFCKIERLEVCNQVVWNDKAPNGA